MSEEIWVYQPFGKTLGKEMEVSFGEFEITRYSYGGLKFGIPSYDPCNLEVWVHEFTEYAVDKLLPFSMKNRTAIAHVVTALHTVSGKADLSLQTSDQFWANILRSKYRSLVRGSYQKRLDRWIKTQANGITLKTDNTLYCQNFLHCRSCIERIKEKCPLKGNGGKVV